jgi:hypothetical protein
MALPSLREWENDVKRLFPLLVLAASAVAGATSFIAFKVDLFY